MVSVTGTLIRSVIEDETEVMEWEIPAFSQRGAIGRARANARIKGMSNITVESSQEVGQGDIPGQSFYRVEVSSPRN